jgi:hypothetical protein
MSRKDEIEQYKIAALASSILDCALPYDTVTPEELNRAMHSLCIVMAHILTHHTTNSTMEGIGMVADSLRGYCEDERTLN